MKDTHKSRDGLIANVRIDDQLTSYKTFFDHDWAKNMHELASGTRLIHLVSTLTYHWKSVANAHMMPWLMTTSLSTFAEGYREARPPSTARVIEVLQQTLTTELRGRFSRRQKKDIDAGIDRIVRRVHRDWNRNKGNPLPGLRPEDVWSALFELSEFQLSILGSQRLCYAGLYFAYENFVRQCTSLATRVPEQRYQSSFTDLQEGVKTAFGPEVADYIADRSVNVARHVRNALVHAGGRVGDKLSDIRHNIATEEGVLQVMPEDTRKLFSELKLRATKLAEKAVTLPVIRTVPPEDVRTRY